MFIVATRFFGLPKRNAGYWKIDYFQDPQEYFPFGTDVGPHLVVVFVVDPYICVVASDYVYFSFFKTKELPSGTLPKSKQVRIVDDACKRLRRGKKIHILPEDLNFRTESGIQQLLDLILYVYDK